MKLQRKPSTTPTPAPEPVNESSEELRLSSLAVYDIPVGMLHDNPDNPNIEDERTFDILCEKIRTDGFDEPVHVVPRPAGGYEIVSGHHRTKAARQLGLPAVPCVIKTGWDEDKRDVELVARNNVRGQLNAERFSHLVRKIAKRNTLPPEVMRAQMGFTKKDAFDKLYRQAESMMTTPAQKKRLAEAKETITSIDDLSSVLNTIFKDNGSELDHGFMVFSFGGKHHYYIQIDKEMDRLLASYKEEIPAAEAQDIFKAALKARSTGKPVKSKP